jgi:hypothetical protein
MDARRDYDSGIFVGVKTRVVVCRGSNNALPNRRRVWTRILRDTVQIGSWNIIYVRRQSDNKWQWYNPNYGSVVNDNVDGFHVARTWGTTRRTQRFERMGLNVWDLGSERITVAEASRCQTHNIPQRETPSFTQVQGPRGEVKPLLTAFLYYDVIPHEEYKALVTEL